MPSSPPSQPADNAVDEVTPLLTASETAPRDQSKDAPVEHVPYDDSEDDRPLPRSQIFLLCYCRLVEPVAFFSIFPFINQMIWETGNMNEADVGFYSGLIVLPSFLIELMREDETDKRFRNPCFP